MKKFIAIVFILVFAGFLVVTNPTTDDFAAWYSEQVYPSGDTFLDDLLANFTTDLARSAERKDFFLCSVFTYKDQQTLGVAMMFFPLDDLNDQIKTFRQAYSDWLEDHAPDIQNGK